jgi:hypothetical protein
MQNQTVTTTLTTTSTYIATYPQLISNPSFKTDSLAPWEDNDAPNTLILEFAPSTNIPGGSHSGFYSAVYDLTVPAIEAMTE